MAAPGEDLLGYRDIATMLGVTEATLRNYRRRGYMPPPDIMLADRPRWRVATIDAWQAKRRNGENWSREMR